MLYQIIPEKCIACGLCQVKAPDCFDYYDDGIVKWLHSDEVEQIFFGEVETTIQEAIKSCPTHAITLK